MFAKINADEVVNLNHVVSIYGYEKETGMVLYMDDGQEMDVKKDYIDGVKHKMNLWNNAIVRMASGSF